MPFYVIQCQTRDLISEKDHKRDGKDSLETDYSRQNFYNDGDITERHLHWKNKIEQLDAHTYTQGDLVGNGGTSFILNPAIDSLTNSAVLIPDAKDLEEFSYINQDDAAAAIALPSIDFINTRKILEEFVPEKEIADLLPTVVAIVEYPAAAKTFFEGAYTIVIEWDEALFAEHLAPYLPTNMTTQRVTSEEARDIIKKSINCEELTKTFCSLGEKQHPPVYRNNKLTKLINLPQWVQFFHFVQGASDTMVPHYIKTQRKISEFFASACNPSLSSAIAAFNLKISNLKDSKSVSDFKNEADLCLNVHQYVIKEILDAMIQAKKDNNQLWLAHLEALLAHELQYMPAQLNNASQALKIEYQTIKQQLTTIMGALENADSTQRAANLSIIKSVKTILHACDDTVAKQNKNNLETAQAYYKVTTTLRLTATAFNENNFTTTGQRLQIYGDHIRGYASPVQKRAGAALICLGMGLMVVGILIAISLFPTGIGFFGGIGMACGGALLCMAGLWQQRRRSVVADAGIQLETYKSARVTS